MSVNVNTLKKLIDDELRFLSSPKVLTHIRSLLVEPKVIFRDWDYGDPGEQYPCWTVLNDNPSISNTSIAYCESGFGPRCPWGLVGQNGDHMSMGMDSGWYSTFLDAYFESFAPTALDIWRVFKIASSGDWEPLTDEGSWGDTGTKVEELRRTYPESRFAVRHSISYSRELE